MRSKLLATTKVKWEYGRVSLWAAQTLWEVHGDCSIKRFMLYDHAKQNESIKQPQWLQFESRISSCISYHFTKLVFVHDTMNMYIVIT